MLSWEAVLSNGEIITESKGDYKEIKDVPSPWQRLVEYANMNNLTILLLSIRDGERTLTLPTGAKEYYYRRYVSIVPETNERERYIFISAVFETVEVQIWVNEQDSNMMFNKIINSAHGLV